MNHSQSKNIQEQKQKQQEKYNNYVKQVTPTHNLWINMLKAFLMGGAICTIGQVILNTCANYGLDKTTSGSWCSLILVLCSVLLTGFNIYPSLANWGGAGALVPITGFANSVCSPAIEFKSEGYVFGMASKMFVIAGPIIVFGVSASFIVGLIYYFIGL